MTRFLLLADVDGTLVDATGRLWPEVFALVEGAASSEYAIALCSARPEWSVRSLAEQLGPAIGYATSFQGAMVSRRVDFTGTAPRTKWETIRRCVIDPHVAGLIASSTDLGDSLWWYTDTDWYIRAVDEAARLESKIVGGKWSLIGLNGIRNDLLKILVVRSDKAELLIDKLRSASLPIRCSLSQPGYIEVVSEATGGDKGASVVRTLARDGECFPHTVAIGDSKNDLGMFSVADVAVTFEDAAADVRAAADVILCADRRLALQKLNDLLLRRALT